MQIGAKGAVALAGVFRSLRRLKVCDTPHVFHTIQIGACLIRTTSTLIGVSVQFVDLSTNQIGDAGLEAIVQSLPNWSA